MTDVNRESNMLAIGKLLDLAKQAQGLPSDNQLAERIGITRQQLSQWRSGTVPVSDDRIGQIAILAKADVAMWLNVIRSEQTEGTTSKAWMAAARRLGYAAALFVGLTAMGVPEKGVAVTQAFHGGDAHSLYIMSNVALAIALYLWAALEIPRLTPSRAHSRR